MKKLILFITCISLIFTGCGGIEVNTPITTIQDTYYSKSPIEVEELSKEANDLINNPLENEAALYYDHDDYKFLLVYNSANAIKYSGELSSDLDYYFESSLGDNDSMYVYTEYGTKINYNNFKEMEINVYLDNQEVKIEIFETDF